MRREYRFFVYILSSKSRRVYTGVTNNLTRRIGDHKDNKIAGHTARYNIDRLVYVESFDDVRNAIDREKQIKAWTRAKRVALIERDNPTWEDLAAEWAGKNPFSQAFGIRGLHRREE